MYRGPGIACRTERVGNVPLNHLLSPDAAFLQHLQKSTNSTISPMGWVALGELMVIFGWTSQLPIIFSTFWLSAHTVGGILVKILLFFVLDYVLALLFSVPKWPHPSLTSEHFPRYDATKLSTIHVILAICVGKMQKKMVLNFQRQPVFRAAGWSYRAKNWYISWDQ